VVQERDLVRSDFEIFFERYPEEERRKKRGENRSFGAQRSFILRSCLVGAALQRRRGDVMKRLSFLIFFKNAASRSLEPGHPPSSKEKKKGERVIMAVETPLTGIPRAKSFRKKKGKGEKRKRERNGSAVDKRVRAVGAHSVPHPSSDHHRDFNLRG